MDLFKYIDHLPTCNKKQDWSEAEEALAACPPDGDKYMAEQELAEMKHTCTCGVNDAIIRFASSWYVKGWMDTTESGEEQNIREIFVRNYGDLINPI